MKKLLQISLTNPLKLILLFIEVIYLTINLQFAPYNHYNHLSTRFCFSFLSCLLSDFQPSKASPKRQNLLVGIKVLSLLSQIRYLQEIDWFDLSFVSQEAIVLDLAFESLFKIFILSLISTTQFVKSLYLLSSGHIFCVLLISAQENQNLVIRAMIQGLLFCLSLFLSHRAMKKKEKDDSRAFTREKAMRSVLDNLCEGVILLDKEGEVKYVNNYLEGSANKLTLQKLSNQFSSFELNDFIPANIAKCPSINQIGKFDLSASRLSSSHLRQLFDSPLDSHRVASLIDIFNLYMKSDEALGGDTWRFRPTFKAKFHRSKEDPEKHVELDARVIQGGLDNEKQLLILIKDPVQYDIKSQLLEKEKTIYQENVVCSLSHELRTPLNANLAFLEQALDSNLIHAEIKEKLIKPAFVSAKLLFYIVSDVIDYSMILANTIKLDMKPKNIIRTVHKCLEIFYAKAIEKNIKLNLVIQGEIPIEFCTDHQRISQILVNLLKNAVQFTIKGTIEVILTRTSNQDIMVTVKDTGIGISQSAQERLHSSLRIGQLKDKIHDNSAGIGFGIFISNKLTKLLNDSSSGIKFQSELGVGSKFYFEVKNSPLSDSKKNSPRAYFQQKDQITEGFDINSSVFRYTTRCLKNRFHSAPSPVLPQTIFYQSKSRVLIVDDEVFNIIVIENFCKSLGISVEKAFNGEEAIHKLKICSNDGQAPLKAIFMDINMPIKDGYQATKEIQQMIDNGEMERVPVIGVTAYGSKEKIEKGYNSGMVEVLIKPLSKEVIMEVLSYYKVI